MNVTTKTSLVPDEDQGVVFVNVSTAAAGSSLRTTTVMGASSSAWNRSRKWNTCESGELRTAGGPGGSFDMLKLKPWDERAPEEQRAVGHRPGIRTDGHIKDTPPYFAIHGMIPDCGMVTPSNCMQDKTGGDVNTFFQTAALSGR